MGWQQAWTDRFYRSRPGWTDGTSEFHALCREHIPPEARILEVGAGPANPTSAFLPSIREVYGVDVSTEVRRNVHLAPSPLIEDGRYPFPDASFATVVSNYPADHVAAATSHLAHIH